MTPDEYVRRLATRARQEIPPHVDISGSFPAVLRMRVEEAEAVEQPLGWVAVAAFSLAVVVTILVARATITGGDAMIEMICLMAGGPL